MRLTVLGSSASYAGPGHACSGYLIQSGGANVMLDIGNGALSNLGRVMDPTRLDAVFVSHAHPDHFADLFGLQAMLRYAPEGPAPPMRVFGPEGLLDRAACLLSERGRVEIAEAFSPLPLADGVPVRVGPILVTPHLVDHEAATFALVAQAGARLLCYTSDTRSGDAVLRAADGADVLLAEATLPAAYEGKGPHMTAAEAGRLAADAAAGELVLTHLWPTTPRGDILNDARVNFSGKVVLAEEMLVIDV